MDAEDSSQVYTFETSDPYASLILLDGLLHLPISKSGKPQSFVGLEESYVDKDAKYLVLGLLSLYTFPEERESQWQIKHKQNPTWNTWSSGKSIVVVVVVVLENHDQW